MTQETPLPQEVVTMLIDAGYPFANVIDYNLKTEQIEIVEGEIADILPSHAVRWLREDKGLHVFADNFKHKWDWNVIVITNDEYDCEAIDYIHDSHDTALLEGIKQALTILNQQK